MRQLIVCAVVLLVTLASPSAPAAFKSTGVKRFDDAVRKCVNYLKGDVRISHSAESLVAYALLKAGEPVTSPLVAKGIEVALDRAMNNKHASIGYDHLYLSGVDAMLLADSDADKHFQALQNIANYVASVQRSDGSFSDSPNASADTSMAQYGLLSLWAAQRAGCEISPEVLDRAATWHLGSSNSDGGWGYRPGTDSGAGGGKSTHTMTLAAAGSMSISRTLIFGPKGRKQQEKPAAKFGVLEKKTDAGTTTVGGSFIGFSPRVSKSDVDAGIGRALKWNEVRFKPISVDLSKIYLYYTLERALALNDVKTVAGQEWFTAYGDGLLTLQAKDGSFNSFNKQVIATSFAILFYMRSTKSILEKQFGTGIMKGGRDLNSLFGNKEEKKKDIGPLDALLRQMESADLSKLDDLDAGDLVERVTFGKKEDLIGQIDLLKKLLESSDASNRQAAYFALGRTGDFSLIPEMLQGLRDANVDVNVEALMALRYISRKPNGFGMSVTPLAGAETADKERKVRVANAWRTKAYKTWADWYRKIRPYEEGGGIDELELLASPGSR